MGKILISNWDIIWSYIGNILKLSINIILLPIILYFLSDDELGLWYVFAGIGQLAILLDFGFAPALSRNIAYIWCGTSKLEREDITNIKTNSFDMQYFKLVIETCRHIYLIIGILALILMTTIGTVFIRTLIQDPNVLYAWLLYSVGVFLNILYSYFTSILRGIGAIAENNKAATFSKISQLILTILFLYYGFGLLGVSIAYLVSGFVIRMFSKFYFSNYKNIGESLKMIKIENAIKKEIGIFSVIWHNASREGLITLSNYLSTQANTLICSSILGLHSTSFYGLIIQITTIIANISMIPFSSYQVALQEKAVTGDKQGAKIIFSTTFVLFILSYIVLSLASIIALPILQTIKKSMSIDYYIYIFVLISTLVYHTYHLMASFISSYNILPYTKAFVCSSIISVVSSYLIASHTDLGLWSLVISPLVISIAYNLWKWPKKVMLMLNCSFEDFIYTGYIHAHSIILRRIKN